MKAAPLIAVALILCIAFPCPIQAKKKPKPKFCIGKDGNQYAVGEGYDANDGKACVHYKCVKKKKKFVMKRGKCVEDGEWSSWSSWSACSSTCGSATKTRTRTCSSPAPSNGGNPCSGPEEQIEQCSNPSCGPDMNVKVDSLELNVQSLNDSVQTLQTTMLSVLELMTTMQSTANKQGTCMMDLSSSDCPDSAPGKIGVVDGINTNKASISSTKADINTNKADININKAVINTNKAAINNNLADINTNEADINTNKAAIASQIVNGPECNSYTAITDSWRKIDYNNRGSETRHCDDKLVKKWYRFEGEAGSKLPTERAPNGIVNDSSMICGTYATAWMTSAHPEPKDQIVTRKVCFEWFNYGCLDGDVTIRVRACYDNDLSHYYVYELTPRATKYCTFAYCALP